MEQQHSIVQLNHKSVYSYSFHEITLNTFTFPGGEVGVKISDLPTCRDEVNITCSLVNSDDVMKLLMLTDALRRAGYSKIRLIMYYVPYARQDRVMTSGESLSIKVFADLINSQNYLSVVILDPHSEVVSALLDRVSILDSSIYMRKVFVALRSENFILVSPDLGASKKIGTLAKNMGYTGEIIQALKTRDPATGIISGVETIQEVPKGSNLLIVDDICDGGATFIQLAKMLKSKGAGKVYLSVTHGIFSKGEDCLKGYIDGVYCTNSFKEIESTYIKQIKL
jgi:ribose-phosphate pyrophosphokinase